MINPLSLLTSPLEKGLAAATAALLLISGVEGLVIKYEMSSKADCVSAVKQTNAETKTVTTAIRNVDNASNQSIQTSVTSSIASDVASLRDRESRPASVSLPAVSISTPSPASTVDTPGSTYTVNEANAEACLTAYDVAIGWQQWYTQTQNNWQNIENSIGRTNTTSDLGSTSQSKTMAYFHIPLTGSVRAGIGLGKEDVGQEQPVRGEGDSQPTRDGSGDTRVRQGG